MSEQLLFPNLFSPLAIGKQRVKNRILSTGHDTVLGSAGKATARVPKAAPA